MNSYEDVISIKAELSAYRKGVLWVKIDLAKRLILWNDSMQWNNNFVRSISPNHMLHMRDLLSSTSFLQWNEITEQDFAEPDLDSPGEQKFMWEVDVSFSDGKMKRMGGTKQYPDNWNEFKLMIENISRTPFRLR